VSFWHRRDTSNCPKKMQLHRAMLTVQATWLITALQCFLVASSASRGRGSGRLTIDASAKSHHQAQVQESAVANPIRKVVTLLQNMAKKVAKEGEHETQLYEKFKCYCTTGSGDLQASISASSAKIPALQSDIETAESTAARLAGELKQHAADRTAAEEAIKEATSIREKEHAVFATEAAELKDYLAALGKAIPAIETGMSGTGLMQLGSGVAMLRRAVNANNQITDDDRQSVIAFLSGSNSADYSPKSGEIVGILKEMNSNFAKSLSELEEKEASSAALHEELVTAKEKEVKSLGSSIEKKTARVGELKMEIVQMKNELTSGQAALAEDTQFLADLEKDCDAKTAEFEERVKLRNEELVAIQETIQILNSDDALELFKKTLPSPSFVQVNAGAAQAKARALAALTRAQIASKGLGPSTRFITLSLNGQKVDFTKVIKMIDDMVILLKTEQADDDSKKEYCGSQIDKAEDKVKELSKTASDLETSIDERKATIAQLTDELKVLNAGIAELDKLVEEATVQRKGENEEFKELLSSNSAAKELLQFAKTRLNKFYNPKLALSQNGKQMSLLAKASLQRRMWSFKDAPDPPPETWGAYQKKGQESSGVVSMINLLIRDIDKEIAEAEKQEEMSQKEYENLMSDSAEKRAKDLKAIKVKTSAKANTEELATSETSDLSSTKKEFMATSSFLSDLHAECDWLMQNFDLRKSARAEEMDNLKAAKAVLSGADFSLLQKK